MKTQNGFTLVELMITLAIAAILVSVGIPSFRSVIQTNRAATQTNELVTALNLARSEAVKRSSNISVCASSDSATCSASSNWATGWILFADAGTAGTFDGGTDTLIRVWSGLNGSTTLTSGSGDPFVQYRSNGQSSDASTVSFTLTVADCTGDNVRNISVSPQGRIRRAANSACP